MKPHFEEFRGHRMERIRWKKIFEKKKKRCNIEGLRETKTLQRFGLDCNIDGKIRKV